VRRPIWDMSVVEATLKRSTPHWWRVEGLAADGVNRIGIVNAAGQIMAEAPVVNNIYHLAKLPPGDHSKLVALDRDGHIVARVP
jgi:hypothetical protein